MSTPDYTRLLAAATLTITYLGALIVEGVDLLNNTNPPTIVTFVLGTGVSVALTTLGIHTGLELQPTPVTPIQPTGDTSHASISTP